MAAILIPRVGVAATVWLRVVSASLVLLLVARPSRAILCGRGRGDWLAIAAFASALALMHVSFYAAIARLPLGVVVTVEFIGPLTLGAVVSHRRRDVIAVVMAGLGVALIAKPGDLRLASVDLIGFLLALLGGACWTAYIILAQRVGAAFDQLHGLSLAMVFAAAMSAPLGLAAGRHLVEPGILLLGAAVGFLSTVVPFGFELFALRSLPASVFVVLLSLHPAVAATVGWAILGQGLESWQFAGMLLVVLASILTSRRSPDPEHVAEPLVEHLTVIGSASTHLPGDNDAADSRDHGEDDHRIEGDADGDGIGPRDVFTPVDEPRVALVPDLQHKLDSEGHQGHGQTEPEYQQSSEQTTDEEVQLA